MAAHPQRFFEATEMPTEGWWEALFPDPAATAAGAPVLETEAPLGKTVTEPKKLLDSTRGSAKVRDPTGRKVRGAGERSERAPQTGQEKTS